MRVIRVAYEERDYAISAHKHNILDIFRDAKLCVPNMCPKSIGIAFLFSSPYYLRFICLFKMASASSAAKNVPVYQPRNYQLEMFEASMKENIIVAVCDHTLPGRP